MVRQFYLENSLGKRHELTNKNFKQFLNESTNQNKQKSQKDRGRQQRK